MRQLDPNKLAVLSSFNDDLDRLHVKPGTASQRDFDEESFAWFYGNMLRERRKELNITQRQIAEKFGREQSYIGRVETAKADIQPSSFFRMAAILGIQYVPTFMKAMR